MNCPICNSTAVETYLEQVTDYMVSKESFTLLKCSECETLNTQPVPEKMDAYYDSNQYLSHHSQGSSILASIYRNIRTININNKINILNSYITGEDLLDVGCGTGDFLLAAKNKGLNISGVEVNSDARNISQDKLGINVSADLFTIKEQYHAITFWHVLEHMTDPVRTVRHASELLHNEGIIILALPNYLSHDAAHYGKYWAGYDVPRHLFHFNKNSIRVISQQTGMVIEQIHPMTFDAFYVALLSEGYRNKSWTNYMNAFQQGLLSNRKAQHSGEYSSLIYILKKQ